MRKVHLTVGIGALAIGLAACSFAVASDESADEVPGSTTTPPTTTTVPPTTAPTTTTTLPPATVPATSSTTTSTIPPVPAVFEYSVVPVTEETVWATWHEDCPVHYDDLSLLTLTYWDFDGAVATGQMTINTAVAADVVAAFEGLFDIEFPIERIALVDDYGGDDKAAMAANITSGFNCRYVDGTERWSNHAFGLAVDINPLVNPWVREESVLPEEGARYVDRERAASGMINLGDEPIAVFEAVGWSWGGVWQSADYMHFSKPGN